MPEIERIKPCSAQHLIENYVIPAKPVIITGLFDHLVRDFEQVMEDLAQIMFEDKGPKHFHTMPERDIAEWLARYRRGEKLKDGKDVVIPELGKRCAPELVAGLHTPLDRKAIEHTGGHRSFFAAPGGFTDIHVDGWTIGSLQYHIAGRKEWFLAPPQASAPLGPVGYGFLMRLDAMSHSQRRQFAELAQGYSFVVEPGETLFWPQQWIHGCLYHEPSFAVVDHFGSTPYALFLSRDVPRCFFRHCIQQKLGIYTTETQYMAEFVRIHDACARQYPSTRERYLAIEDTLRTIYNELFPEGALDKLPFDFAAVRSIEELYNLEWFDTQTKRDHNWDQLTGLPRYGWWKTADSSASSTTTARV